MQPLHCRKCRYLPDGLTTGTCPECATTFTPGDPDTTAESWYASPRIRRWMNPPGLPLLLMTAIAVIGGIKMLSAPGGGHILLWIAAALFALFVAAAWMLRFAIAVLLQWSRRGPSGCIRRCWKRWAITPALFAFVLALGATDVLHRVRFELSRPHLIAAAGTVSSQRNVNRTIGLYHIGTIEQLPDGSTAFWLPRYGFIEAISLIHAPGITPASQFPHFYEPIAPDWYILTEQF